MLNLDIQNTSSVSYFKSLLKREPPLALFTGLLKLPGYR